MEKSHESASERAGTAQTATYVDGSGEKRLGLVNGGGEEQLGHWEQMEKYYKTIYDKQVESNNAAAAASTARTLSVISEQIRTLNEEYRSTNRQLYRDYMESRRDLPQQLSASGYSGGVSESGRIGLETGYQEALGGNERARLSQIAGLNAQGLSAQQTAQTQAQQANAGALTDYYGSLASLQADSYSDRKNRAETLGRAGDFSTHESVGYTSEQAEQLRQAWEAANPDVDMGVKARNGYYTALQLSSQPPAIAQRYLNALGYVLKVNGVWDAATETAYQAAFGMASGRYSAPDPSQANTFHGYYRDFKRGNVASGSQRD